MPVRRLLPESLREAYATQIGATRFPIVSIPSRCCYIAARISSSSTVTLYELRERA
jgi:hypothetical protein